MRRHIELEVTFKATIIGGDEFIPDSTAAEETVKLTIPTIESKYAVFPKLLEGVTLRTIQQLRDNVSGYLDKQRAEEKRRKEGEQLKLAYGESNDDADEWEGDAPVTEDDAEQDDGDGDGEEEEDDGEEEGDEPSGLMIDFDKVAADAEAALAEGFGE